MHSMFRMDNYEGPNLPEDFNLAQYSEVMMSHYYITLYYYNMKTVKILKF